MALHWGRISVAAAVAAVVPLAAMALLMGSQGSADAAAVARDPSTLLRWVEAFVAGFAALGAAYWVARPLPSHRVLHGLIVGVLVIALDVALLVGNGTEFHWMHIAGNFGRLESAVFGGWIAGRGVRIPSAMLSG
ncbi:MAG: hypothetical protein V4503_03325 [Gemmatimonadota bacterium]